MKEKMNRPGVDLQRTLLSHNCADGMECVIVDLRRTTLTCAVTKIDILDNRNSFS